MIEIELRLLEHKEQEWIGIFLQKDNNVNDLLKQHSAKWSRTHRCWYLPLTRMDYEALANTLKGVAHINSSFLKEKLQLRKTNKDSSLNESKTVVKNVIKLNAHNREALQAYIEQLQLKAYSASTIKTYKNEFLQLLQLLKNKNVNDLTANDIKRYMVYAMQQQGISENTAHSRLNALKFYFEQVLKREKFFWDIPRPKKPLLLPKLLNEKELGKLFNSLTNKKHKAMLFTAYSAGLRVSEIVNLRIKDIDSSRMQIFIRQSKGKKDRYVNLSPVLLDILRNYISHYKPRPKVYLFESEQTGLAYPIRTAQQIFMNAKGKAGILKDVGIHSLRHSFATHLLDKGTDIRFIKDLLGHFDIRTTERYLHVSKRQLVNVISPLDELIKNEHLEW
jgi:site-specific recombinase XerD